MRVMPESTSGLATRNTIILIEAAARLGLPVVVSQQYPQGLGSTIAPIENALADAKPAVLHRFDKLSFSAVTTPEFSALLAGDALRGRDQWIVAGVECHVCVYQTARDLVGRGFQAHVVRDATCSRTEDNWRVGLDLIDRAGGIPTSTEVVVFDLLGRAGGEDFKVLSKLVK